MKKRVRLIFNMVLLASTSFAQTLEDTAREVWSEPMLLFATGTAVYPAITSTGDTLYCVGIDRLSRTVKINGSWSALVALPPRVNSSLAKHPTITPDGRRLYFIDHSRPGSYGGWDLWMTEWSDSLNDWGEATNLGSPINTTGDEWCAYAPDNKSLVFVRSAFTSKILLSRWNDTTQSWSEPVSVEQEKVSRGWGVSGITMTANQRKIYVGRHTRVNDFFEMELMVSSRDSSTGLFTTPGRLSINSHPPDTLPKSNPENRGYDAFPSITPDGIWMFFQSDRADDSLGTNFHDIYVSRLLVDENGDTVVTSVYDDAVRQLLGFQLLQNYPNPFNPQTTIEYTLPRPGYVVLDIFDSVGRYICRLVAGERGAGDQKTIWNGKDSFGKPVSSGVYYYRLSLDGNAVVSKKLLLLR